MKGGHISLVNLPTRSFEGRTTNGLPMDCFLTAARNSSCSADVNIPKLVPTSNIFDLSFFHEFGSEMKGCKKKNAKKPKEDLSPAKAVGLK